MNEKYGAVIELELDDEALDAFVEVMKPLSVHARCGEKRIALLSYGRQPRVERSRAVLALVGRVMPKRFGDGLGLVDAAATNRARVDLDEADELWGRPRGEPVPDRRGSAIPRRARGRALPESARRPTPGLRAPVAGAETDRKGCAAVPAWATPSCATCSR